MKLRILTAAAVLSLSFAGAAYADGRISASLKTPVPAKVTLVVAGALFVCEGDTCVASSAPSSTLTRRGCKALVKEVGALTAFGGDRKAIEGADLEACNAIAAN
ncbi:MAG: hypothetical protein Q8L66_04500 [Caulobacter sp.]|nr:hypothetical protein [Caulobacter sp.]